MAEPENDSKLDESRNSNDEPPITSSTNPADGVKKRKSVKLRSTVWEHFDRYDDCDGNQRARCRYCSSTYAADSNANGTSSLGNHIRKCVKNPHNFENKQAKLRFQPTSKDQISENSLNIWRFDQESCRKALARMVIVDEQPFSLVEREGFKHFINIIQPIFRIPSRATTTRDCFELFLEKKKKLKSFLKESHQRICITTDTWTSIQRINYMCLTSHFIDKDWKLHKKILNFCPISSHKGDDMAIAITKCLIDWGVDKVFTITVDNASSNDTTVKELSKQFSKWGTNLMDGSHLHVRCVAHIINLIVQDGLKEVGDSVKRVRQALRYIRQSPARIKRFKDCCEIEKIESKKSLGLDVPTRWNSTYLMLNTAQEFENAFVRYAFLDPGLLDNLLNHTCEDGKIAGAFNNDDWMKIRHMVKFLETFYDLTLRVSGSLYVTSNVHFHEIGEVACILKMLVDSDDIDLSFMAERMKAKFDKYWGVPEKMNKMIFVACVLDPRFKFEYVAFVLLSMYGEEKGEKMRNDLKLYVISLYNEYQRTSKESQSKSLSSVRNTMDVSSSGITQKKTLIQQEYLKHRATSGIMDSKSELEKYLGEETEPGNENFDILLWWKVNSPRFPILAKMARDVLAIPISTVASESAFSTGGRVLDPFRSSLTPKLVQALVCAQDWLRGESLPLTVEEDLDKLEKFEDDLDSLGLGRDSSSITDL